MSSAQMINGNMIRPQSGKKTLYNEESKMKLDNKGKPYLMGSGLIQNLETLNPHNKQSIMMNYQ